MDLALGRLQLDRLPLALARDDGAGDLDRAARGELQHLGLVVRERVRHDRLHGVEARAVGDGDERDARLRVTPGADPALDGDRRTEVRGVMGEEISDANSHRNGKIGRNGVPEDRSANLADRVAPRPLLAQGGDRPAGHLAAARKP